MSEDRISGFLLDPFAAIAEKAELDVATVHERLRAMLAAKTIRRIRQTLMATNLAPGALVAWRVDAAQLDAGFDYLAKEDPFSGHVVIRSTDTETPGSVYRLWTTLKVPQGFSMTKHCDFLAERIGATAYRVMPAKRLFALGVGHVRRRGMEPGSKTDELGAVIDTNIVELTDLEWRVLEPLKREFTVDEITDDPWVARAPQRQAFHSMSSRAWQRRSTSAASSGAFRRFSSTSSRRQRERASRATMRCSTGACRKVGRSKRAARSAGTTFSRMLIGAKAALSSRM